MVLNIFIEIFFYSVFLKRLVADGFDRQIGNLPYYNIIRWYRFCEFHCIFGAESSSDDRLYIFSDECFIINMGEESQHSCLVIPHDFHRVVQCVAMSGYTQYTMFFY